MKIIAVEPAKPKAGAKKSGAKVPVKVADVKSNVNAAKSKNHPGKSIL